MFFTVCTSSHTKIISFVELRIELDIDLIENCCNIAYLCNHTKLKVRGVKCITKILFLHAKYHNYSSCRNIMIK